MTQGPRPRSRVARRARSGRVRNHGHGLDPTSLLDVVQTYDIPLHIAFEMILRYIVRMILQESFLNFMEPEKRLSAQHVGPERQEADHGGTAGTDQHRARRNVLGPLDGRMEIR